MFKALLLEPFTFSAHAHAEAHLSLYWGSAHKDPMRWALALCTDQHSLDKEQERNHHAWEAFSS